MKSSHLVTRVLALVASSLAACEMSEPGGESASSSAHDASWCYGGDHGPDHWSELSPDYALATLGGSQSPVDIRPAQAVRAELPPLRLEYQVQSLRLINNGHTVQADVDAGHALFLGDERYELLQFHFHAPSEHWIDGRESDFEFHFVHRSADGHLVVLGVMGELGEESSPQLRDFLDHAPAEEGGIAQVDHLTYDPRSFFPAELSYYAYDGSLTTPPVSEGVRWFVLQELITISRADLDRLRALYSGNHRPPQPLHARWILRGGEGGFDASR